MTNQGPVDLSDLDPFSPHSSQSTRHPQTPLFPTSTSSSTSSTSTPSRSTAGSSAAAQHVHSQPTTLGPLGGLLSHLDLSSQPPPPPPPSVLAQDQRHSSILSDLDRQPFSRSPPPHPHPPPRRLSTLMSPSSLPASTPSSSAANSAFSPSSPPASSNVSSDFFHPASVGHGAERRMRQASGEWPRHSSDKSRQRGASAYDAAAQGSGFEADTSWGDFVEAPPTPPNQTQAFSSSPPPTASSSTPFSATSGPSDRSSRHPPPPSSKTYPDPSTLSARTKPSSTRSKTSASLTPNRILSAFDPTAQPIRLVGLRDGVKRVLDEDVAEGLRPSLPPRLRVSPRWTLLYSLDQHGISLSTLFSQLDRGLKDRDGGFVLIIRTERGEVCGGYVSEALKKPDRDGMGRGGAERWVGDGSCFLFSTAPFPPSDPRLGLTTKTYKPTFRNTFFAHASPPLSASSSSSSSSAHYNSYSEPFSGGGAGAGAGFIALGGGNDGNFGLWIDGYLERGWTGRCETFGNEPLIRGRGRSGPLTRDSQGEEEENGEEDGERGKFEVVGLECWAVGT
ncbi:hypothetical protein JCM11641_000781 [Rhodosporidiobolus odoratus]